MKKAHRPKKRTEQQNQLRALRKIVRELQDVVYDLSKSLRDFTYSLRLSDKDERMRIQLVKTQEALRVALRSPPAAREDLGEAVAPLIGGPDDPLSST